ncbi:MAG: Sir2 family NAD+-dependent deacetylase [Bdellovibrionota bacterium]
MKNIVVLTGAGISAESGIKTFRDSNGLWENHRIEDVASSEGFYRNPKLVYEFYNLRRRQLKEPQLKPNSAHEALKKLEDHFGANFLLVTQNVDNLHDRIGHKNLIHMHGELQKVSCQKDQSVYEWPEDLDSESLCPDCKEPNLLRPHIVWFGEMPLYMEQIYEALSLCDIFISIGTSGHVYPAAGFVAQTPSNCLRIEINNQGTNISQEFDKHFIGPASTEVPKVVDLILSGEL